MSRLFGLALAAERQSARRGARQRDETKRRGRSMRAIFAIFPLLAIPVIIYNLMAMFNGGAAEYVSATGANVAPLLARLEAVALAVPMIGNVTWEVTGGEVLILLAISLLFLEILKSTSTGTATIMNHAVSLGLFIVCLIQFLLIPNFATSTFFIIMVMTVLDVLAGIVVTIVAARRDFSVGEGIG